MALTHIRCLSKTEKKSYKKLVSLIFFADIKLLFLILLVFSLSSCKSNSKIDEQVFVNLYADLLIAKEMNRGNDSDYIKVRDSIYAVYKVDHFMVQRTLDYYNSDTEKWKNFFQKVVRRLEEQPASVRMSN
jgi:hypothetical protein